MKTKTILKLRLVLMLLSFAIIAGGVFYFLILPKLNQDKNISLSDNLFGWKFPSVKFPLTGSRQLAYSDIRDPGGIPQGLPVRLKIPVIGVDSAIEDALITPDGRMDVPAGSVNVAWFALGPHPGKEGSAVIGGHFGIRNGVPFVFYELDKLKVGDKIYIIDDKGATLAFVVRAIKLFDRDADATEVFTSNDGIAHLNLITCEGIWNRVNDTYPKRRVIFTDAIPTEAVAPFVPTSGNAITKAEDIAAFPRVFGIGAGGTDVAALQTFLVQKGFLKMPIGVIYGFFGPLTRAKFLAELGGDTGLPNAGSGSSINSTPITTEKISVSTSSANKSSSSLEMVIQSIKSLFTTPKDAAITLLLLVSIIFIAFKAIRSIKNIPVN